MLCIIICITDYVMHGYLLYPQIGTSIQLLTKHTINKQQL